MASWWPPQVGAAPDARGSCAARRLRARLANACGACACVASLLNVGLTGCSSADDKSAGNTHAVDGGLSGVHPRFELTKAAMPFGAIPWPDDLYLGANGKIDLAAPPGAPQADYAYVLRQALGDLDGFSAIAPAFVYFDGDLDPSTLPADETASVSSDASVFLTDADTGSPDAFRRIPATVQWLAAEHRLALRPSLGHPLTPGQRYAAVVTRKVLAADGSAIDAGPLFSAIRDPAVLIDDERSLAARASYTPVIETLLKHGLKRSDIAAIAVFTVQTVATDLSDARLAVHSATPLSSPINNVLSGANLDALLGKSDGQSPGLDDGDGAPHAAIAALVQGTLSSPNFLSAAAKTHGTFERDDAGQLRVKRTDDVPFTLLLPHASAITDIAHVPVVLFAHGLGRERSDALAVGDALTAAGFAVLAIDAPFHGSRAQGVDQKNRFTGKATPDGFGDDAGDFFGEQPEAGNDSFVSLHPLYLRDALRQGVVDWMSALRYVQEGDLSALHKQLPELAGLAFATDHVGFVGVDLGAQMGTMLATVEPSVDAAVLALAGGPLAGTLWQSASEQAVYAALCQRVGRNANDNDTLDPPEYWPELALLQTLYDRAEPLAHASTVQRLPINLLMLEVHDDEVTPNATTEALASALSVTLVTGQPRYVPDVLTASLAAGGEFGGNFGIEDTSVTRVLFTYEQSDHQLLIHRKGSFAYEHPPLRPFAKLARATTLDNPIDTALAQITHYFVSWRGCTTAPQPTASVCSAGVLSPLVVTPK